MKRARNQTALVLQLHKPRFECRLGELQAQLLILDRGTQVQFFIEHALWPGFVVQLIALASGKKQAPDQLPLWSDQPLPSARGLSLEITLCREVRLERIGTRLLFDTGGTELTLVFGNDRQLRALAQFLGTWLHQQLPRAGNERVAA